VILRSSRARFDTSSETLLVSDVASKRPWTALAAHPQTETGTREWRSSVIVTVA
jgi:hypothetical protein